MVDVRNLSRRLAALRERWPSLALVVLFGSHARGTASADSDVDFAVQASGIDLLELRAELEHVVGADVDVVSLHDASVPLLQELIRDGVVVYEGHPGAGATWRARSLVTLETDGPWYTRMRDAWLRSVAEKGLSW